jgi:hypothetical protein
LELYKKLKKQHQSKYKKYSNLTSFSPQKSVLINKVKLFNNPHEIDRVKLPRKNKIKDLFEIAIFNSFIICLRVTVSVH